MKLNALVYTVAVGLLASSLMPTSSCHAVSDKPATEAEKKQGRDKEGRDKAMGGAVKSQAENAISQQRKKIIDEAVSALAETKNALRALDEKKTEEALAALERASGKLNIVLARDPKLALAPVDVDVTIYAVYTTLDAIKKAKEQAEDYLEDGEVQKARVLIRDLASEIIISVVSIPLQTYPDAIKAVAPLIDQGKIDDAKAALEATLNTLVVVDHIIPLPLVRADVKLAEAETLAQKAGRSEEDNKNLEKLLNEAREQLKLAEALGYGNKKDYQKFYAEIEKIEEKTEGGKSGQGLFAKVKEHLSDLRRSIFG
jgi:hypothetical protein